MKDEEWRKKLFHFSTLGVKITSSPLKGEDRGEGEGKGKFLSLSPL